jgi:hypothetical protein
MTKQKKTTFKVMLADGSLATRSSLHPYTHVLLGREDFTATRARIHGSRERFVSDFDFYTRRAAADREDGFVTRERAQAEIAGFATATEYADAKITAAIAKSAPEGIQLGPEVALRWSASAANASKGMNDRGVKGIFTGFRVVEVYV